MIKKEMHHSTPKDEHETHVHIHTHEKTAKKTSTKKESALNKIKKQDEFNSILLENFVHLQKAMTNLVGRMDNMTEQISSLLRLFEVSAKTFSERLSSTVPDIEKDREFLDKLNKLLDQNKLIAKGLTLMEDKMRERLYGSSPQEKAQPSLTQNYLPSALGNERSARPTIPI